MTRSEYKEYYYNSYGTYDGWKTYWKEYKMNDINYGYTPGTIKLELAPLPMAKCSGITYKCPLLIEKEEGKPMRYNDNCASVNIVASDTKSEAATQREYLLDRLSGICNWRRDQKLMDIFNLHTDNSPKTYKEMIDMIKNGKYTLDKKLTDRVDANVADDDFDACWFSPWYGIIWDGPQPDHKGYNAAIAESNKLYTATKDTIMSGVYADGLKALQDFEAWLPTPGTPAN